MNDIYKKNLNKGYAILFAVVIVSIISLLAIGLSNSAYKQLVLSSLAKDSQSAFFMADTATECSLYADNIIEMTSSSHSEWYCGKDANDNFRRLLVEAGSGVGDYNIRTTDNGGSDPCYEMFIIKDIVASPIETSIKSRGYNSCDFSNPKTVQREIEANY